ncbi:hypothetical protein AB0J21_16195 [Streptomyces sp. NPDC049954]|uniref:hypothetical protein n=1 Tax=Streptomyces sp. NPDC049954 TaxID=3155779 RepID=UPI003421DF49
MGVREAFAQIGELDLLAAGRLAHPVAVVEKRLGLAGVLDGTHADTRDHLLRESGHESLPVRDVVAAPHEETDLTG